MVGCLTRELPLPVTARLSRAFYERLGDDVANELVEWLNQVDLAYRSELRELNELHFARFEAKVGERLAAFETQINKGLADVRVEFSTALRDTKTSLIWWMFGLWTGNALATAALVLAILKALR
jgi:hypothetical protein